MSVCDYIQYDEPVHERLLRRRLDTYVHKQKLLEGWTAVIDDTERAREVRSFLERYPHFLPGFYEGRSRCGVVVVSLPFCEDFIPDFTFITINSSSLQLALVKIERPTDKIFHTNFSFTPGFMRSLLHVRGWKSWSCENKEGLVNRCLELFQLRNAPFDRVIAKFFLVYGRRSEVEPAPLAREIWNSVRSLSNDIGVMTFDELTFNVEGLAADKIYNSFAVCACKQGGLFLKGDVVTENTSFSMPG